MISQSSTDWRWMGHHGTWGKRRKAAVAAAVTLAAAAVTLAAATARLPFSLFIPLSETQRA